MKRVMMIAIWISAGAAFGGVIYENDFATRTSAGAVPMSEWRTYNYVADFIAHTNGASPFADSDNVSKMQDGWIKTPCSSEKWSGSTAN